MNEHGELKIEATRDSITIVKADVKKIEVLQLGADIAQRLLAAADRAAVSER